MKSGEIKKAPFNEAMDTPQSDLFVRNCVLNIMVIIVFFVEIVKLIKIKGEKIVQWKKKALH